MISSSKLLFFVRRCTALICCFSLLCLVSACGDKDNKNLIVVGFSQLGAESDWRIANTKSMTEAFSEENGYELIFDNAMQRQENQLVAIRNFILQGVDIIVLAPVAETGWDDVLLEAKNAGIPVIIVDREVSVPDESLYLSAIGSDFLAEGQLAVQKLDEILTARGMTNRPINILHLKGTDGATAQIMRTKAIGDAAVEKLDWHICASLPGEFTEAKGYEEVRNYISRNRNINVIYSENDNMTFGAMRALDEAGLTYGENGDIIIVSFDAGRRALNECLAGRINLCVECNPLHGPKVDELIKQYRAGQEIPKHIHVDEGYFTPSTLTQEIIDSRKY